MFPHLLQAPGVGGLGCAPRGTHPVRTGERNAPSHPNSQIHAQLESSVARRKKSGALKVFLFSLTDSGHRWAVTWREVSWTRHEVWGGVSPVLRKRPQR